MKIWTDLPIYNLFPHTPNLQQMNLKTGKSLKITVFYRIELAPLWLREKRIWDITLNKSQILEQN